VIRALEKRDLWRPGTRLDSWMMRMMRNIWIDEARARRRRAETFVAEDAGLSVGASGGQEEAATLGVIDCGLRTLPDEQREAVLLRDRLELTYEEAAETLGISVAALKSRLFRGRERLREMLGDLWPGE